MINCGYSTITYNKSRTKITVNTCFYIPDNHLPDNEKALFNQLYVALGMNSIIESYSYEGPSDLKSKQKICKIWSDFWFYLNFGYNIAYRSI